MLIVRIDILGLVAIGDTRRNPYRLCSRKGSSEIDVHKIQNSGNSEYCQHFFIENNLRFD